ncbi:MAG: hypothetical protein K2X53_04615, partial [Alphaproteobacteria bacterium]|nr:hypothetical protein [Alphaproteobacteria bacterium]
MIYHLSIPAHDPATVSQGLAELLGPKASIHRFPIDSRGYFVIAGTKTVAAIEVYPADLSLK